MNTFRPRSLPYSGLPSEPSRRRDLRGSRGATRCHTSASSTPTTGSLLRVTWSSSSASSKHILATLGSFGSQNNCFLRRRFSLLKSSRATYKGPARARAQCFGTAFSSPDMTAYERRARAMIEVTWSSHGIRSSRCLTISRSEPPSNEMRVSCGAILECSQTDGLHRRKAPTASRAC